MSHRYFALSSLNSGYGEFVLNRTLYEHFADVSFFTGRRLADTFPPTTIVVDFWRRALDYFEVGSVTVVSARLREFLERQQVNAEYLEVEVVVWPRFWRKYFFANFLDVIAGLDQENSRIEGPAVEIDKGWTYVITKLCLDESKVDGKRMFILSERFIPLIREDLVAELRSAGFAGLHFTPLPDGMF